MALSHFDIIGYNIRYRDDSVNKAFSSYIGSNIAFIRLESKGAAKNMVQA